MYRIIVVYYYDVYLLHQYTLGDDMSRKKSTKPSTFRFICMRDKNTKNYHVDFDTKEEALKYVEELNDSKIEWYGLYEINPDEDYFIPHLSKRLIPHDDTVPEISKDNVNKRKERHRRA